MLIGIFSRSRWGRNDWSFSDFPTTASQESYAHQQCHPNRCRLDCHYDPSLLHGQAYIYKYIHTKKRFYRDDDIPAKASMITTICAISRTGPRPRIN
jgi:hypothetical protein